ncbi:uncharacterized protein LACBIDRAFT_294729 [Laccaria bicolor S238N-H82]|uniref:Predicted protein n=1 Tax=Laccaria bicolor (strain S238N-H82 / ATCC MYA-4686) TaxID=486041 RepID=B0DHB6_LACBS|nr:uncharacterized protein LACBIDRAFT_294729 [Laccaria bicolor S238N-H82]EDR05985.1 predicted protein [Laccaria bicolor S238N-H82]|eukprot:XP_001883273.1 predicted protein [Laccaria bicolor S238N-H82]
MSSSQLLLMVDDPQLNATYGGRQWVMPTLFQCTSANVTESLSLSFEGIAIAFSGNTPKVFGDSQTLTVSMDGAPSYNTSYNDPTPRSYTQWYQSPILTEGTHNITLTHMAGTALDYAVITAGQNTPLTGKTVIIDNEDPSITFTGSWTRNTDRFSTGYPPNGYPFHNSTHQSTTPGDNFVFRFSGKPRHCLCIIHPRWWNNITNIYRHDIFFQVSGQHYDQHNFLLYSNTSLTTGDHTLVVNVTKCVNQTFIFDYLTYQPSFSTLATMPNLTLPASTNGTSHTTTTATPVGAMVGGVIGGLALLFLLIGAFLWFRRRKAHDDQGESNQITAFAVPRSKQENLGAAKSGPPSTQISPPESSSSSAGSTVLLQSGPPRVVHKSSRSHGAETVDVSTSGGGSITTEMREARHGLAKITNFSAVGSIGAVSGSMVSPIQEVQRQRSVRPGLILPQTFKFDPLTATVSSTTRAPPLTTCQLIHIPIRSGGGDQAPYLCCGSLQVGLINSSLFCVTSEVSGPQNFPCPVLLWKVAYDWHFKLEVDPLPPLQSITMTEQQL